MISKYDCEGTIAGKERPKDQTCGYLKFKAWDEETEKMSRTRGPKGVEIGVRRKRRKI